MSEDVWVIHTINSILDAKYGGDMYITDIKKAKDIAYRNAKGEVLPASAFSKKVYAESKPHAKKLRHITSSGMTVYLVSPEFADVMREFNMGNGNFYPAKFFAKDQKTPLDWQHMYWNFGNVKDCVLIDQSPAAKKSGTIDHRYYRLDLAFEDGGIAVSPAALEGPDVWVDPQLKNSFFISGRLMAALKKKKLDKGLSTARCRIVG